MSTDLFKERLSRHMEDWLTDLKLSRKRVSESNYYVSTEFSWLAAVATPPYMKSLHQLLKYHPEVHAVWFENTVGVYKQPMPFWIDHIGLLEGKVLLLMVHGRRSDRIQRKWTARLEKVLGYPVTINWTST